MRVESTEYNLIRYNDGVTIGRGKLTPPKLARYLELVQRPEGFIRLGDLPLEFYELDTEYQDLHEDILVFFE